VPRSGLHGDQGGERHHRLERPLLEPGRQDLLLRKQLVGEIWAYDYDVEQGTLSNRRTFCRLDTSRGGAADGSTVDAEGFLWNAQVYDS
jgi:L-arabinonolactonase